MFIENKQKQIGELNIDLNEVIESNKTIQRNIQNCPDKNAQLFIKFNLEENKNHNL